MAKRKARYRLPVWIRKPNFKQLNRSQKDFLGYLYSFGPDTCWLWNWRLAKKFYVKKRTIRRWLRALREQGFIWIEHPYGAQRLIHTKPMFTPQHWLRAIATTALSSELRKDKYYPRARRNYPESIQPWHSPASIELARHAIINELLHRGETFETAVEVAEKVIQKSKEKSKKKKGTKGGPKCPP